MRYLHKYIIHSNGNIQFFMTFPDQCLLFGFPRLYFAADKLPQQSPCLIGRTLSDHKFIFVPDQSSDNLCGFENIDCFQIFFPAL